MLVEQLAAMLSVTMDELRMMEIVAPYARSQKRYIIGDAGAQYRIGGVLLQYNRSAVEDVVPVGMTSIDISAFRANQCLECVILPGRMTSIAGMAFASCAKSKRVVFKDKGLESMGNGLFHLLQHGSYSWPLEIPSEDDQTSATEETYTDTITTAGMTITLEML